MLLFTLLISLSMSSELEDCVFTSHFKSSSLTLSNYPPMPNTRPTFTIQGKFSDSFFISAIEASLSRDNGTSWLRSTSSVSQYFQKSELCQFSQSLPLHYPQIPPRGEVFYSKFVIHGSETSSSIRRALWCYKTELGYSPD